jgi:hypothetical protein
VSLRYPPLNWFYSGDTVNGFRLTASGHTIDLKWAGMLKLPREIEEEYCDEV